MKKRLTTLQLTACLLFTGFSLYAGVLEQSFWDGVTDADGNRTVAVEDLRAFPGFPDAPVDSLDFDPAVGFSTPRGQGDDFGSLIKGYIVSPVSGEVTFYNASDDGSEFLLSTDDTAGNLQLLGKETGCCTAVFSGARIEERSGTVTLEAGGIYYFEALYQEGGGGDWMDVGWELPDGTQEIIPSGALLPFSSATRPAGPPQADFIHFPFDQFVPESSLVTFRVDLFGSVAGMKFQWKKNGADIAGAIVPWITVSADLADDGTLFSLNVTSDAGSVDIDGGSMFVEPDFDSPSLVNVRASGNPQGIIATFSEFVDEASATNTSNYTFSGQSFTISEATLLSDGVSVLLSVGSYNTDDAQLSISNVKDTSNASNVIAANSSADVVFKSLLLAYWDFNTAGTTTTDVIGGHTGTVEGNAVFTDAAGSRTGNAGDLSLDFGPEDTDQLVRVENADWLNVLGEVDQMTVTVWQKLHAVANTSTFWMSSESSGSGDRGAQVHIPWSNNNIYFDTAGCCDGGTQRLNGALPAESFLEWHHYTFVKDGIDKRIYVDGELFLETVNTNPLPTDFSNLMIGADGAGGNNLLGIVDDFAIFSAPLAAGDIVDLAGGGDPSVFANPIAREITLTTDLADQTAEELEEVTFSVEVAGTSPSGLAYTWWRDGNPISNAKGASITIIATLEDNGAVFKAEAFNIDGAFNRLETAEATLTVESVVDGADLVSASGSPGLDGVSLTFDKEIDVESATDATNYSVTDENGNDIAVTGAEALADGLSVRLNTGSQTLGAVYTVTAVGVKDTSTAQNPSDTSATFAGNGSLVVFFDFNDASDSTVTIDNVNGVAGAIEGDAVFTEGHTGNAGDSAMDFGPDSAGQIVRVADAPWLNVLGVSNAGTVSFWQRLHNIASTSTFWLNNSNSGGVTNGDRAFQAHVPWGDGNIYFDTAGCCNGAETRISAAFSSFPFYTEENLDADGNGLGDGFVNGWHHYAFVKDGDLKQIWIDGELFLDGSNNTPFPNEFTELIIGANGTGGNSVHGVVDDFAIFATGLDSSEIGRLAAGELPTDIAPTFVIPAPPEEPSDGFVLLDFGGEGASGAGPSPEPWITLDSLTQ
ncbi:MAG TPA: hypothetical protein EYQ50_22070, partial [Verrucomicrobiales bacterium]|nr:hypothetical protein [Verrucomicrobiales bacterium]